MMKRAYLQLRFLALAAVALWGFSSVASADIIYIDNHVTINGYSSTNPPFTFSSQPGSRVLGMAFSPQNSLITADDPISGAGGLYSYSYPGGAQTPLGSVANPLGLAIDGNGNIYVGANGGTSIDELNPDGTLNKHIVTSAAGILAHALALDANGNVYAADNNSGNIYEYFSGGGSKVYSQSGLDGSAGYGMAFDPLGNLFVTYQGLGSGGIDEYDLTGALTSFYSVSGAVPADVAYDSESHKLYMSYGSSSGFGGGITAFSTSGNGTLSAAPTNFQTFATGTLFTMAYQSPEPGTVLLFAGGLLSIGLLRLRKVRG